MLNEIQNTCNNNMKLMKSFENIQHKLQESTKNKIEPVNQEEQAAEKYDFQDLINSMCKVIKDSMGNLQEFEDHQHITNMNQYGGRV